jgi:serine/threonine protein phosphatase PrpC
MARSATANLVVDGSWPHDRVTRAIRRDSDLRAGTTVVVAMHPSNSRILGDHHVGDSRAYRLWGRFELLTTITGSTSGHGLPQRGGLRLTR